jgi:hypothetical protein
MSPAELRRLREAGFTYKEIERMTGVPWSTVRSRCQSLKIRPRVKVVQQRNRPAVHDYPRWLIHELYWVCELSTNDIAYELDMKTNSVATMMRRLDIPLRSRQQAWDLMKRRGRMPPRRPWTREEAREAARIAAAKRRREVTQHDRDEVGGGVLHAGRR